MIKLKTECAKCTHVDVCKYKGNAESDMNKLKNMMYGKGPNDDYTWDIMIKSRKVDIIFSCPMFTEKPTQVWR